MRTIVPTAAAFLPDKHDLTSLREAAKHCEGCPLYANATQTVFGAGPARAEVMMVGEQPGDVEDRQGKPPELALGEPERGQQGGASLGVALEDRPVLGQPGLGEARGLSGHTRPRSC